jgi:HK97 family phage prohead protease
MEPEDLVLKKEWIEKAVWYTDHKGWDSKDVAVVNEINYDLKIIKKNDDDTRNGIRIIGFLSTFKNVDREGDIVMEGAFDQSLKDIEKRGGKLPLLFDHFNSTSNHGGSFEKLKVTSEGLKFEAFISETPKTTHQLQLIKDGHLNTVSMGGLFKFKDGGERNSKDRRFIEEVVLFEGSIVSIPANPKATFVMKSLDDLLPKDDEKSKKIPQEGNSKKLSVREKMNQAFQLMEV